MNPAMHPPQFQLSLEQYHALVAYQAHLLMQTQWAMALKDRELVAMAAQLAELRKQAATPEAPAAGGEVRT